MSLSSSRLSRARASTWVVVGCGGGVRVGHGCCVALRAYQVARWEVDGCCRVEERVQCRRERVRCVWLCGAGRGRATYYNHHHALPRARLCHGEAGFCQMGQSMPIVCRVRAMLRKPFGRGATQTCCGSMRGLQKIVNPCCAAARSSAQSSLGHRRGTGWSSHSGSPPPRAKNRPELLVPCWWSWLPSEGWSLSTCALELRCLYNTADCG